MEQLIKDVKQAFVPQGQPLPDMPEDEMEAYLLRMQQMAIEEWNANRRLPEGILEAEV